MRSASAPERPHRDLVLVGAGHAHVQVLRRFAMRPLAGVRLWLVVDRPEAVYSGMVPGFVAGDYAAEALEIDALPLARRAGAEVVLHPALRVDPEARWIELVGRPPLRFDAASLDVGSAVRGLELPGVREHALATRPIRGFVDALEARLARLGGRPRVLVVGAGAAGLELAFTLAARLRAAGRRPELSVCFDGPRPLADRAPRVARVAEREAARAGIALLADSRVVAIDAKGAFIEARSERLEADLVVWAAGAAPPSLIRASELPQDAAGFVRVDATLAVTGCPGLFAAGDCAALDAHPWVPKAGVYAVRQGPLLDANLRAWLSGGALRAYQPQRDFLALLHLGAGRALAARWGRASAGTAWWRLKDAIDRRFVRRFRVLDASGAPARDFPAAAGMGDAPMACGGCAAKLGEAALERALARLGPPPPDDSVRMGLERPDDAAAVVLPRGDLLLASVDGFRAFCGDAWLVGRVAAVNAVSDVFAKGGRPRHALALVTLPEGEPERAEELLYQALAGVRAALDPLGVSLVGGHTTLGAELFVGLSITGLADAPPIPLGGARPGERLLLSKALGTGVLLAADAMGRVRGAWLAAAHASMLRPNDAAAQAARDARASAATDVSGFGLAGHLGELLEASGVSARIEAAALPALDGALELLGQGLRSSFHPVDAGDRRRVVAAPGVDPRRLALVFDPQTSGGLLFSVPAGAAAGALAQLQRAGDVAAAVVGEVTGPRSDGAAFALE